MAQGSENSGYFQGNFKTVDQLRSIREEKNKKSPEQLKASAANKLYYKASPIDDYSLDQLLEYMDRFAEEKDSKGKQWLAEGLQKYADCTFPDLEQGRTVEKTTITPKPGLDFETTGRNGSTIYADDVTMENLLRARADGAKERIRIQKYKKHMRRFLKVYEILKGGGLDSADALKMINAPAVREAYNCGLREATNPNSFWELSRMSLPIKMETFAVNRRRLFHEIAPKFEKGLILMKGGEDIYLYDSGEKYPFRQEPFFLWTFGAIEPNLWGMLDCWTGKAILLGYRQGKEDHSGRKMLEEKYEVNHAGYTDQIQEILSEINPTEILILNGVNPDSNRRFPELSFSSKIAVNKTTLYEIMSELRVIKSNFELDLMRYANRISSLAHRLMMKKITADSYEYQAEAFFKFFVHFVGGCSSLSYSPMCASGRNSSDPNYSGNQRMIKCEDFIIFDMGASHHGYASSIACTVPAGGIFDREQKIIYDIALQTRNSALDVIKAGVFWSEVHDHAMRTLLSELKKVGIISGGIDKMLSTGVSNIFMPFGIGHFLGLDKFDVGGLADLEQRKTTKQPHLAQLRTARILKPGMVMALQVGCYFNLPDLRKALSDEALNSYFVKENLEKFVHLGGVFIKDNIVVNHQGYEMMTDVPRTVQEIEDWLAGKTDADLKTGFELDKRVLKDELWIGSRKNPCVKTETDETIK